MATLRVFCAVVNRILNIIYLNVQFKALNMKQTRNMFKERYCFCNYYWRGEGQILVTNLPINLLLDFMLCWRK